MKFNSTDPYFLYFENIVPSLYYLPICGSSLTSLRIMYIALCQKKRIQDPIKRLNVVPLQCNDWTPEDHIKRSCLLHLPLTACFPYGCTFLFSPPYVPKTNHHCIHFLQLLLPLHHNMHAVSYVVSYNHPNCVLGTNSLTRTKVAYIPPKFMATISQFVVNDPLWVINCVQNHICAI